MFDSIFIGDVHICIEKIAHILIGKCHIKCAIAAIINLVIIIMCLI